VQPNKAIVGANAFRHESGIHQDGVLKNRSTYEIIRGEDVGFQVHNLVLGKHSGRHAFDERLKTLGVQLKKEQLDKAFDRFKDIADKKKEVFDEDLLAIVDDEVRVFKDTWEFVSFKGEIGTNISPEIEVVLKKNGKTFTAKATGDGPVNAAYKAIDSIAKIKAVLLEYSLQSVTHGKDALGEVTAKVQINGKSVISQGTSTDIVEASARAYVNAINKVISQEKLSGK
jgi:2-isopropylmalate synthase